MEPTSLVCRASPSAIRMCVTRTEYVLSWAIRQNLRARKISPRIKVNWTLSAFGINSSGLLLDLQWSKKHGFLSLWEVFISLSVVRERRATSSPFHTRKTFPSIHSLLLTSMETIQPSTLTSPRLPYRQRRKSWARGRTTGSLNHLFNSKRRGS